ncbi:MAG TPA: MFS transporter [Pseudonocardiaceae bacterium]|nr:MFS transporter [Pseudonocardiaceae bacterium]
MPSSDEHPSEDESTGTDSAASTKWLSSGVAGVGAASFFSDSGHEITTAILPTFLTSTLHASAGALGIIEGVSDALTGVMKLIGGPLANDPRTRGRLASGGYLGTAVATGAIGLAATVWQVGLLRGTAWLSRGLRSPARDSLLATLAPRHAYGRAFGLERAGDNLGAVAGPLLAAGLVVWLGIRPTLYLAAVPGLFAAIAITVAAREARRHTGTGRRPYRLELSALRHTGILRPLVPIALFELGNVATTLLILRATQLLHTDGRSLTTAASAAILIYALHNAVATGVALLGGRWLDAVGPRIVFATGSALYVVAYLGFAIGGRGFPLLIGSFALAGAGIGLAETAESTLVARMLPDRLRGSGFGVLGGVQAAGDLLASAVVGLLYTAFSPLVGFGYAAGWMIMAVLCSVVLIRPGTTPESSP